MWLFGVLEGKNSEVLEKRGNEIYDCYNKRSTRSIWRIHDTGNDLRSGKKNELHFVNVTTEKKKKEDSDPRQVIPIFHDPTTRSFSLFFHCVCL